MGTVVARTISTMDVCRASGLSYRVIDYWVRVGAVEPSVPARGSGHSREWSPREFNILVALGRVWRDLNELGLTMGTALVRQLWVELYENGAALIALDTVMIGVSCD